jgi:hypothetical protein
MKRECVRVIYIFAIVVAIFTSIIPNSGVAAGREINNLAQAVEAARALDTQLGEITYRIAEKKAKATGVEIAADELNKEIAALESDYVFRANEIVFNVASIIIDLDFARKKHLFLQQLQAELAEKAEIAEKDFRIGRIDAKTKDEIKKEMVQNDFDLNFYRMQISNLEKSFQRLTGEQIPEEFDFNGAYLIADAGKIPLPLPVPDQTPVADEDIDKKFSDVLSSFSNLGSKIGVYIEAGEELLTVEKDFKTGKVDSAVVKAARDAKEHSYIDALESKAQYSKLLFELDFWLQGHISRDIKKTSKFFITVPPDMNAVN